MTTYRTLRAANDARHVEWDKDNKSTHSFYATELAGEMGEALWAYYVHTTGGEDIADHLTDELADVAICLDLVARRFAIDLPIKKLREDQRFEPSLTTAVSLGICVGMACNEVKKLEREELGMVGSRSLPGQLARHLRHAMLVCAQMADGCGIDLEAAVAAKFNKTSAKYGLTTMMAS